jgi:hypothetical protein
MPAARASSFTSSEVMPSTVWVTVAVMLPLVVGVEAGGGVRPGVLGEPPGVLGDGLLGEGLTPPLGLGAAPGMHCQYLRGGARREGRAVGGEGWGAGQLGQLGGWGAERLGSWAAGQLGRWAAGPLGGWAGGQLGSWAAGELDSWAAGAAGPLGRWAGVGGCLAAAAGHRAQGC